MARSAEEVIERGRRAEELLKNTLLNEAFESVLARVTREWLGTKRESGIDRDEREELHATANAIAELRGEITAWANDAIAAKAKIAREEKRKGTK